jgi:endonuclease VIII
VPPVVELVRTSQEREVVGHLGPDPMRDDWHRDEAIRRMRADPDRPVVAALLDQRVVAGVGNLWANEISFLRGVSPCTRVGDTRRRGARRSRRDGAAPLDGGTGQVTTGDTRRGESHWVSGRAGRPCRRCGTTIRVIAEVSGDPERRRTWWCPHCQPGPTPVRG